MIEVYPKLFVGSQDDLTTLQNRSTWDLVHAAKEPWHRQLVKYKGRDPEPNHPEFYIARTPHSIALNMVDSPHMKHFYPQMVEKQLTIHSTNQEIPLSIATKDGVEDLGWLCTGCGKMATYRCLEEKHSQNLCQSILSFNLEKGCSIF